MTVKIFTRDPDPCTALTVIGISRASDPPRGTPLHVRSVLRDLPALVHLLREIIHEIELLARFRQMRPQETDNTDQSSLRKPCERRRRTKKASRTIGTKLPDIAPQSLPRLQHVHHFKPGNEVQRTDPDPQRPFTTRNTVTLHRHHLRLSKLVIVKDRTERLTKPDLTRMAARPFARFPAYLTFIH